MRRVCVFCGSNPGYRPDYPAAAQAFAASLTRRGLGLVYGGASVGVMGSLADAVLSAGGEVIGVMPKDLLAREVGHRRIPDLRVVGSMHERKALMASLCDGFVALPGGMGTLDELCEVITWAQLGIHQKPVALLDVKGYWDPFLRFLDHVVAEGFLSKEHREMLLVGADPDALLEAMEAFKPVSRPKWLGLQQT